MKLLISILAFFALNAVFSQALSKEELAAKKIASFKQNRLSFNIGFSNPTGDFASTNLLDQESGFAGTGLVLKANYTYLTSPSFGFTFDFTNSNYSVQSDEIEELTKTVFSAFATNINYDIQNYNLSQFTAGMIFFFGKYSKFYINPVIGYSSFRFAEESVSGVFIQNTIGAPVGVSFTEQVVAENDEKLFYAINAGLDVPLSEDIFLNLNVQYHSIEYEFSGTLNYSDSQGNSNRLQLNESDIQVSGLNFGIGLSHYF